MLWRTLDSAAARSADGAASPASKADNVRATIDARRFATEASPPLNLRDVVPTRGHGLLACGACRSC
jgi:hypothetical protein